MEKKNKKRKLFGKALQNKNLENSDSIEIQESEERDSNSHNDNNSSSSKTESKKNVSKKSENPNKIPLGMDKAPRVKQENKKSRLVIRNLHFQATEEKIRKYFSKCGSIKELNLLKKPDGKLIGCCFIQYSSFYESVQAMKDLNLKPFMGRLIAIDWALPKDQFQKANKKGSREKRVSKMDESVIKIEDDDDDEIKIKEEQEVDDIKEEKLDIKIKEEPISDDDDDDEEEDDDDEDDDEEEDEDDQDKPQGKKRKSDDKGNEDDKSKIRKIDPNDADEGKTIFIRNLDFDINEENLKSHFKAYGKICYAVICKNPINDYPKGTGFVKYWNIEDTQKCLESYENDPSRFKLGKRDVHLTLAMTKGKLTDKFSFKNETKKETPEIVKKQRWRDRGNKGPKVKGRPRASKPSNKNFSKSKGGNKNNSKSKGGNKKKSSKMKGKGRK